MRLAGWLLLLPAAAVLGDYFAADLARQSVVGGGGTLGAWVSGWLEEQLKVPADLRIIGSSVQFVADDQPWEKWGNFPLEQAESLAV